MEKKLETMKEIITKAIDFHCHGVGTYDFTELLELDLYKIEAILAKRQQRTILTLYLPHSNFQRF